MSIRTLLTNNTQNQELVTSLKNNDEYVYAHLIKFEKPRLASFQGNISGKASEYSYITDAPYNIKFDDGSVDSKDFINGEQTYVANKVLKVGSISETVQARASNLNLTLSGNALGTLLTSSFSFSTAGVDNITASHDLIDAGFQEGDSVLFEGTGANNNLEVRLDKFYNDNKSAKVTVLTGAMTTNNTPAEYNLSVTSSELLGLIHPRNGSFATYINREVTIYRAHIEPETGEIIGAPFLIFKGIITTGNIQDNVNSGSQVNWVLVSHWGDFVQVTGRLTSDSSHRALDSAGNPDKNALIRPEYSSDYGFIHSDRSINMIATYQDPVTRYKMKKRGGLAGLIGKQRLIEYTEMVDRDVDLQFNLSAKYLPVVYGVQLVDGFPIFADSLASNSNVLYTAHAICEGEISGILDVHIDDETSICINANDSTARSSGTAQVLCAGRADRGDVLGSSGTAENVNIRKLLSDEQIEAARAAGATWIDYALSVNGANTLTAENNTSSGQGLQDLDYFTFSSPIDAAVIVHTGSANQLADSRITTVANDSNFKIQQDFFEGVKSSYWGPLHRLLDTAYITTKFTVGSGETTIPDLSFVVKGKLVDCHNYDYSYAGSGDSHSNFNLGDEVTLHRVSDDSQIGSTVTIIDKWSFYAKGDSLNYRFRFSDNPQVAENVTDFYMKKGSFTWTMSSNTSVEETSEYCRDLPSATVSARQAGVGGVVAVTLANVSAEMEALLVEGSFVRLQYNSELSTSVEVESYNSSTNQLFLNAGAAYNLVFTNAVNATVYLASHVKLHYEASSSNNAYINSTLELTTYDSQDNPSLDVKLVTSYNSTYKVVVLDAPLALTPTSTDKFKLVAPRGFDLRATTNPAMQLLDYLTSKRYGKGLDIEKDIDLESFKEAARLCDTRSDVTVQVTNSMPSVGSVYKYAPSGTFQFQGTVKSVSTNVVNTGTYYEVVFTDVIGKLGRKWSDWRTFNNNDLVYWKGKAFSATSNSIISSASRDTFTGISSISLEKVGGGTALTVSIDDGYNSAGNPIVKQFTNDVDGFSSLGYSLYDSDDAPYWVYLGWDEPEQRYVTRHQTNHTIDTSVPIFDNINSMLSQFNGMMPYSNGKYSLDIKRAAPTSFDTAEVINEGDLIGQVKVTDKGQKDTYNSVTAQIIDPANKFGGRSITFMNSEYLKQDKGVRRQGNFSMPGVTNYYNARLNIKQYLDESRYGNKITFKLDQKSYLLAPGSIIKFNYSRFSWEDKLLRIDTVSYNSDGTANITALEHNDEAYLISNLTTAGSEAASEAGSATFSQFKDVGTPKSLTATDNDVGGIRVTWKNADDFDADTHATEIHISDTDNFGDSVLLTVTPGNEYTYGVTGNALVTKYFWVRHITFYNNKKYSSDLYPAVTGEEGSSRGSTFTKAVKLTADTYVISYTDEGNNPSPSENQTLTATHQNVENPYYSFKLGAENWTTPSTSSTTTFTPETDYFSSPITMQVRVYEDTNEDGEIDTNTDPVVASDSITIFAVQPGTDGSSPLLAVLTNEAHTLPKDNLGTINFGGSGTTIRVYQGTSELAFSATYDTLEDAEKVGKYKVVGTSTATSAPSVTGESSPGIGATIADYTAMTSSKATVDFSMIGTDLLGNTFSLSKRQSISQAVQGANGNSINTVKLESDVYVITYDEQGSSASPSDAQTLTANAQNFTAPQYRFKIESGEWSDWSNTNTATFTPATAYFDTAKTMRVEVRETSDTSITASDSVSISAVKPGLGENGKDAITFILENDPHTLPTTTAGVVTLTGSGTTIRVYEGATELTYDGTGTTDSTYTLTATGSGVTVADPPIATEANGKGAIVADYTAMTADNASVTFALSGKRSDGTALPTISRVQSLAKAKQGATGNNAYSNGLVVLYKKNSTADTAPTVPNSTLKFKPSTGTFTVPGDMDGWTFTKPGLDVGEYSWVIQKEYSVEQLTTATEVSILTTDWSSAVILDSNLRGVEGDPGLKTTQGYVYYVYDPAAEGAPENAPSVGPTQTGYSIANAKITGLNDTGINEWLNVAPTVDPTSGYEYFTAKYTGEQAAYNSTSITVTYSDPVSYMNFTGVVTFSDGTFSQDSTEITTIDGGNIKTGSIKAKQLEVADFDGATGTIEMESGVIKIRDSAGTIRVVLGDLS